jgi:hypothetical protein
MISEIKFVRNFCKLNGQRLAELLKIERIAVGDLSDKLISQDTAYIDTDGQSAHCELSGVSDGEDALLLVFLGDEKIPFTALCGWSAEKDIYFRGAIGKIFSIAVSAER